MHSLVFITDNIDKTICDILHILPDALYRRGLCDVDGQYKTVITRDVYNGFNIRKEYEPTELLISVTSDEGIIRNRVREYYLNNESFLRNGEVFITMRSIAKMLNDQYSLDEILDLGIKLNALKESLKENQHLPKDIQLQKVNYV